MLLRGERPEHLFGNLLIYALMDGECRFVPIESFYKDFHGLATAWASELAATGERPYIFDDADPDSEGLDWRRSAASMRWWNWRANSKR